MESLLLGGSASHAMDLHGKADTHVSANGGGQPGTGHFIHSDQLSGKKN